MKKLLLVIFLIVVIAVLAMIFLGKKNSSSTTTLDIVPTPTSQNTAPNTVSIQNFSFNPETLTIKAGTTVTWTNNDSVIHNIKSPSFNSPDLNAGETFSFTFGKPGTFNYSCGIHPTMTGTIIVQ